MNAWQLRRPRAWPQADYPVLGVPGLPGYWPHVPSAARSRRGLGLGGADCRLAGL